MGESRQLKAILFSDIKSFSAMMGEDEARTVRLVREHRAIVRDALERFGGEEQGTAGDSFFVLFDSSVEAVRCAQAIQTALRERNAGLEPSEQVWIRIGIHVGDILVDDAEGQVYGEAVNIAARTEPLAEPGGICITSDVHKQIGSKLSLRAVHMGRAKMKNIADPPDVYKLELVDVAGDEPQGGRRWARMAGWVLATGWAPVLFLVVPSEPMSLALIGSEALADSPALVWTVRVVLAAAAAGLVYAGANLWRRGRWNRWIHGDGFFLFALVAVAAFAYTHARYSTVLDMLAASKQEYARAAHSKLDAVRLADAVSVYLNRTVLIAMVFATILLVGVLGFAFMPARRGALPYRRFMGVLGLGLVVTASVFGLLWDQVQASGAWPAVLLLCWVVTTTAAWRCHLDRVALPAGSNIPPGTSLSFAAFKHGLLAAVYVTTLGLGAGQIGMFVHAASQPPERRFAAFDFAVGVLESFLLVAVALVVPLFALTAGFFVRDVGGAMPWGRKLRELGGFAGSAAAALAYPFSLPSTLASFHQDQRTSHTIANMAPIQGAFVDVAPRTYRDLLSARFVSSLPDQPPSGSLGEPADAARLREGLGALPGCSDAVKVLHGAPESGGGAWSQPATCLSPAHAQRYCESIGARLPSPEEWGRALDGARGTQRSWEPGFVIAEAEAGRFHRSTLREWTGRRHAGAPVFFRVPSAHGEAEEVSPRLVDRPTAFRCAFSFE